jgi:hypothetical protein
MLKGIQIRTQLLQFIIEIKINFMKQRYHLIYLGIFVLMQSCKKDELNLTPLSSLNLVTAIVGGGSVKLNDNIQDSAKTYNSKLFGLVAGTFNLAVYLSNDMSKPCYNTSSIESVEGANYSLFLTGGITSVEGLFVEDKIPPMYIDSSIGIRVVNLSPNSSPLNITLASEISKNVFTNLGYKQISEFVKFPLPNSILNGSATFQVRDQAGKLLVSYALPVSVNSTYPGISIQLSRFRNLTLVIKGLQGTTIGGDALGVFPVANY